MSSIDNDDGPRGRDERRDPLERLIEQSAAVAESAEPCPHPTPMTVASPADRKSNSNARQASRLCATLGFVAL
jgi:hypothetical protein